MKGELRHILEYSSNRLLFLEYELHCELDSKG